MLSVTGVLRFRALEKQIVLIEQTPLEEAWKNVLDSFSRNIDATTVNSWLKPLRLAAFENATLTHCASPEFIGGWVESHYLNRRQTAWKSAGYEVGTIRTEKPKQNSAA